MHAFLIISQSKELANKKIEELIRKSDSQKMEFNIQKIADIRELKSFLKINLPNKTAIVINDFNLVTSDAQNAFLKELEEPQEKLIYILSASSQENILPTILSRCEVVELSNSQIEISEKYMVEVKEFFELSVGEKLKRISTIKDRGEAVEFMNKILIISHTLLINNQISPDIIEEVSKTLKALKQNGNVQLQLTNFIVKIER